MVMKLLNVGCGYNYHPDWINLDLYQSKFVQYYDIRNRLPFSDNSVDVVYHSHVLEHLGKSEGQKFIAECLRVLRSGGIIRIAIPDLEQICREYLINLEKGFASNDQKILLNYKWNKIEFLDQIVRQQSGGEMLQTIKNGEFNRDYLFSRNGEELEFLLNSQTNKEAVSNPNLQNKIINFLKKGHLFGRLKNLVINFFKSSNPQKSGEAHRWMYDRLDLRLLLEEIGFKDFRIVKYNESRILDWNKYNLDKAQGGDYPRKPDSLFVEAIK